MDIAIIKGPILEMLRSKKFVALLVGVAVLVAGKLGLSVALDLQDRLVDLIMVYIGAQGVADAGKGFAVATAAAKVVSTQTPTQP